MALLHCLNVRDQGLRQEDAKYLKAKPAETVSVGSRREQVGAEGKVARGPCTAHQSHTHDVDTQDAAEKETSGPVAK